jgi:HD-GYP domain-containing protein (c-di-GMP phosphodiesterase class II)
MKISERITQLNAKLDDLSPETSHLIELLKELNYEIEEQERQIDILSVAGADLSKLQKQSTALELILNTARNLTNADGGTVYIVVEKINDDPFNPGDIESKSLSFEVLQNETMNTFLRRKDGGKDILPPVPLEKGGKLNLKNVSAYCANTGKIINIPDVYNAKGFDFAGMKKYDQTTGYHSKSMLVLPLRDHENELIGVLQLINRQTKDGKTIPFSENDQTIVHAMAYQAAISLTTKMLLKGQVNLFDAFVRVLAEGLGEKSPYTYGHINRVAKLSVDLAATISEHGDGMYKGIKFDDNQMEEIRLAGWMHDIGKLTTPEHVVSKSIKLELLVDRFELIVERYNSKIKDYEIEYLNKKLAGVKNNESENFFKKLEKSKNQKIQNLVKDLIVINKTNTGGEFLEEADAKLVVKNARKKFDQYLKTEKKIISGQKRICGVSMAEKVIKSPIIDPLELDYLLIAKGTLSDKERKVINDHADRSWRWLMRLPFPKNMVKLPLYAGAHHETLDGDGYPNQLIDEQLPIQSRIIAVVDIFEALTANDRPYKQPMRLSKALMILGNMVKDGFLDAEIVRIFLSSRLHEKYADQFMDNEQIDNIDVDGWIKQYYPKDFTNTLPVK